MADREDVIRCPGCGGSDLSKYGHGARGRQKWRCLECRRQFTPGQTHLIDDDTRALVMRMLAAGIHPDKIKEALGPDKKISRRWLYQLARKQKT